MGRPTAAVVICAYTLERWDDLRDAVLSAASQTPAPSELLLVVDHNELLLERARRDLVPLVGGLEVVPNSRKQGLSGARNTAVEHVRSDVVVFLDDDASATPGWLGLLLGHYDDPEVLAVGGSAAPRWPDGTSRPVTLPASGAEGRGELDWVVGCTYEGQPTAARPVRNLMGCNMSFRRRVFAEVGGFDENLGRIGKTPLGCEETELCIRAHQRFPGATIVFEPYRDGPAPRQRRPADLALPAPALVRRGPFEGGRQPPRGGGRRAGDRAGLRDAGPAPRGAP